MKQILRDLWKLHDETTQNWKVNHGHFYGIVGEDKDGHFVIAEMNQNMANWKKDEEFIIKSHKMFPRLLQAIELLLEKDDAIFREHFFQNPDMEFLKKVSKLEKRIESILEGTNDN